MGSRIFMAYGRHINTKEMARRCPTARLLGTTTLPGYRLRFIGEHNRARATIIPVPDASVPVILWELTSEDEAALDREARVPRRYRKETMCIEFGGKMVEALVYLLNAEGQLGVLNNYYSKQISLGYIEHRFPVGPLLHAAKLDAE